MKTLQIKVKIISNKKLKNDYWHLVFESGLIAAKASAGKFLELKVNKGTDPLLRRPISIHGVSGGRIKLIYEVVGKGTQCLSERRPGEFLDVIGPLGNGFNPPWGRRSPGGQSIIVAGGMGVAPLVFLAAQLKSDKPLVLLGARTKEELLCQQEFKALGCKLMIATDNGSLGFKGRVTDLLKEILSRDFKADKPANIYACGPQPMLKAVSLICRENNIASQLSLERHMACGFGACLGCVVSTKTGYKRVCKEGPVFSGEELMW